MTRPDDIAAELLLQLFACSPLTRPATALHRQCLKAGFDYSLDEIKRALGFMVADGVADEVTIPGQLETQFKLTATGFRQGNQRFA